MEIMLYLCGLKSCASRMQSRAHSCYAEAQPRLCKSCASRMQSRARSCYAEAQPRLFKRNVVAATGIRPARLKREPGENPGQNPLLWVPTVGWHGKPLWHMVPWEGGQPMGQVRRPATLLQQFRALVELEPEHTRYTDTLYYLRQLWHGHGWCHVVL